MEAATLASLITSNYRCKKRVKHQGGTLQTQIKSNAIAPLLALLSNNVRPGAVRILETITRDRAP